jgi:hypothetical protein
VFADGFEVARGGGGMQGELAAGESAFAAQEFDDGLGGASESDVEWGLEHVGSGIHIAPGVQDGLNDILLAEPGRDVERGPAFGEADVFFGGSAKDFGDFLGITQFESPAEGFRVEHKQEVRCWGAEAGLGEEMVMPPAELRLD